MARQITFAALLAAVAALAVSVPGQSSDSEALRAGGSTGHGVADRGGKRDSDTVSGGEGVGIINSVALDAGVVNITHGPIPSLRWPEMTMDLPVTPDVDLGRVQPGEQVRFRVELGSDRVYRITDMEAAP